MDRDEFQRRDCEESAVVTAAQLEALLRECWAGGERPGMLYRVTPDGLELLEVRSDPKRVNLADWLQNRQIRPPEPPSKARSPCRPYYRRGRW